MLTIPITANYAQTLTTVLNQHTCHINIYQKFYGVFVDLYVDTGLIIGGVLAEDRNFIGRDTYLGFLGDIGFIDTQGNDDPNYVGLGSRFVLVYLTPAEVAIAQKAYVASASALPPFIPSSIVPVPPIATPSLDFSDPANSQYIGMFP